MRHFRWPIPARKSMQASGSTNWPIVTPPILPAHRNGFCSAQTKGLPRPTRYSASPALPVPTPCGTDSFPTCANGWAKSAIATVQTAYGHVALPKGINSTGWPGRIFHSTFTAYPPGSITFINMTPITNGFSGCAGNIPPLPRIWMASMAAAATPIPMDSPPTPHGNTPAAGMPIPSSPGISSGRTSIRA